MASTNVRQNFVGKMRKMQLLAVLLVPAVILIMGAAASHVRAQEISEAEVFFEFNSTDLDLGFDIFLDADPWVNAIVEDPDGEIFIVDTDGGLRKKGNTEIMTESAEPPFCEDVEEEDCDDDFIQDKIDEFQAEFPEGEYIFKVTTVEGDMLETTAELSHDLPAAPDIRRPREGTPIDKLRVIRWQDPSEGDDPEIIGYEVVAEMVIDGETFVNTATFPGNFRRIKKFTMSPEFLRLARKAKKRGTLEEFKVEVIARAENLNKTISEVVVFEAEEE